MTISDERFRDTLIDYLYGELPQDERAAFEASLAESPLRRREYEALRDTLHVARSGLGQLETSPPPRVRLAVERFAQQQERSRAAQVTLWSRLVTFWRNPVLVASLGFVTVVALAVINRRTVFAPQRELERDLPNSAPAGDEPQGVRARERPADHERDEARNVPGAGESPLPAASRAATNQPAHDSAATDQPARGGAVLDRRAREPTGAVRREAPPAKRAVPEPSAPSLGRAEREYAQPPPARASQATPAPVTRPIAAPSSRAAPSPEHEYAQPPSAASEFAEPPSGYGANRAPSSPPSAASGYAQPPGSASQSRTRNASPAAAASKASAAPARGEAEAADEGVPAPVARESQASRDDSADQAQTAPDPLVKRAQQALAEGRASDAVQAYRELLARYPADPRASQWQKQLTNAIKLLRQSP